MNEVSPPFIQEPGIIKNHIRGTEEKVELKLSKCYSLNKNNDRMGNFETDFGKNMFGSYSLNFVGRIKKKKKEEEKNKNEQENVDDFGLIGAAPVPFSLENKNSEIKNNNEKFDFEESKGKKNNNKNEIKDSIFINENNKNNELSLEQKKIISQGQKNPVRNGTGLNAPRYHPSSDRQAGSLYRCNGLPAPDYSCSPGVLGSEMPRRTTKPLPAAGALSLRAFSGEAVFVFASSIILTEDICLVKTAGAMV